MDLSTLHFADEVSDPQHELGDLPDSDQVRSKELDMACNLSNHCPSRGTPLSTTTRTPTGCGSWWSRNAQAVRWSQAPGGEVLRRSVHEATGRRHGSAPVAYRVPTTPAARGPAESDGADGVAGETKAELGRIARQLDIPGRSTMTKDALVAAIGNAQADSDTRKAS